jgi:hypothetical protein
LHAALSLAFDEEREDRRNEVKTALDEIRRTFETKFAALEQASNDRWGAIGQWIVQHIEQLSARADALGEVIAAERADRHKEAEVAIDEAQRAFETKLTALEKTSNDRRSAIDQRIEQPSGRVDDLGEVIATERADRRKEVKAAVDEAQRAFETKLAALEQAANDRWAGIDQRIIQHIERTREPVLQRTGEVLEQCDELSEEFKRAIEEKERASEAKLAPLEERLKAVPGKLPVAKIWHPETVTYQAEFVSHNGQLWQACRDTAQAPGGSDWICVACAGRDGVDARTPKICGTYDAHMTYEQLDVVAMDGASFIARHENPGVCPGEGWQLLSRQGRPGRKGDRGERGERGVPGEPAGRLINSKVDENYNLVILRSDDTLEIIPLREAFERYYRETSG